MKEIIDQLINQVTHDQKFLPNTKYAYKSDFIDLAEYIEKTNTQLSDINQEWVRKYLADLEETNKEKKSFNRRASTFRFFLRYLYLNKFAPTNYALIVNSSNPFEKTREDLINSSQIEEALQDSPLSISQKLILLMIGKLGVSATQISSLHTHQVDFENRVINISDTEKIYLPKDVFYILRKYLLEDRSLILASENSLSLFFNEKGIPLSELDIYKLVKKLSADLQMEGKLTTRTLRKTLNKKPDILSMQREYLRTIEV